MVEIKSLAVFLGGRRVGTIALTPERQCAFQYDADWIAHGISISPFELPLDSSLFFAKPILFDGGFGVFDDSLPDGWGRLVFDRYLRSKGEEPERLSVLQTLALAGSNGRGALEYRTSDMLGQNAINSARYDTAPEQFSFEDFENITSIIFHSSEGHEVPLETAYRYSGSSGGARPKAFVAIDGKEWLVKFHASTDKTNTGEVEYEYSLLAKRCGIQMPETRLFEKKYFGTQRFDRTPDGKIHVISAAALLNADYRIPSLDYVSLLNACRILTEDMRETEALFRLMVFNVIIKNRDDHAKNFAFLHDGKKWRLTPAFDLLPSVGFGGYHTTTVNGSGEPDLNDVFAVAKRVGISENRAKAVFSEVAEECMDSKMAKVK